ncbi:MAG: hypothetical protein GWP03_07070, partial [Proteobacteria bacterium]|nr:hypothetical protein [Pseudomonadota bacterium]
GNKTQKSFDINVVDDKLNAKFCTIGPEYNGYISDSTLLEITIIDSAAGIDSMMYKIDGGNYIDYTEPFSIGDYAEGAHKIDMKITDLMGNVFEDSANYILDKTSPVINSEIVGNHFDTDSIHFLQNSSFLVSLFSDSLSGVLSSGFKINNLGWSDIPDSFDINLSSFSDGYYRIELRSRDRVENISYDTIYLCLDDSAPDDSLIPVGRYIEKGDTLYLSGDDEIGISCRDDYSGTDSIMWAINNGIFSPYTGNISMSGVTAGVNYFIVKTSDLLGNQRTDTSILNIDNVPPVISDTLTGKQIQIDSTIFVKDSTRLRLIFKDTSSGIYENSCKINNFYTIYLPDTFEMDFSAFADGFLNLLISSEDNVGNNDMMNLNYCVDNTPPDIDISYVRAALFDSVFTSPHSAIFINCADGYSGIDSIIYKINNGNYYPYHDSITCSEFTEGKHYISVMAKDRMGNDSTLIDSFYQDNSAPEVTFTVSGPHFMSNDTVFVSSESKISFEETDNLSGPDSVFYSFDGIYLPYTGDSISLTGEDSVYTLYYFGKDRVGNVSDTSRVFFYLDNTPPSVNIYFPFNKIVLNKNWYSDEATGGETDSFYFRYCVSDKDSIESVIYFHRTPYDSVVADTFALSSEDSVKYDYAFSAADPVVGIHGPYMFTIKTEDMLGNSRLDTLYGFEGRGWYDMINGQYNFFTVKNDFIYVLNPLDTVKNNRKEERYDILPAGVYKYDLDGNIVDTLPENDILSGIKVDDDENIYSLYFNSSNEGRVNDTVALKINFATGVKEFIVDSIGEGQLCGIDLDSTGNIYIGMSAPGDTLRIDIFNKYLNLTSINRFPDAKRSFTLDDSQNIYIVFRDTVSNRFNIKRYNKSVIGYVSDDSFNLALPYAVDSVRAMSRDSFGIFYITADNPHRGENMMFIMYPMYDFNNEWNSYAGYEYEIINYATKARNLEPANRFIRYKDKLYYISNNLYVYNLYFSAIDKKAKKFSGEGTNKNLEISEFVPYPSPFNPI